MHNTIVNPMNNNRINTLRGDASRYKFDVTMQNVISVSFFINPQMTRAYTARQRFSFLYDFVPRSSLIVRLYRKAGDRSQEDFERKRDDQVDWSLPIRRKVKHLYGYDILGGIKCRLMADSRYLPLHLPSSHACDVRACRSKWIGVNTSGNQKRRSLLTGEGAGEDFREDRAISKTSYRQLLKNTRLHTYNWWKLTDTDWTWCFAAPFKFNCHQPPLAPRISTAFVKFYENNRRSATTRA